MPTRRGGFLRNNLFLVAAVALPLVVAGLFLVATAVPRWSVPPPAYDLVLRATRLYDGTPAKVSVDFVVRDGRVIAVATPAPENLYAQAARLFLFEHASMRVRELRT